MVTACAVAVAVGRDGDEAPVRAADAAATPTPAPTPTSAEAVPRPATGRLPRAEIGLDATRARTDRSRAVSRSAKRVTLRAKPKVIDHEFMTASLNLWPAPRERGRPLDVLEEGGKVAVTGASKAGFAQILHDGQVRWVKRAYLADKMPKPAPPAAPRAAATPTGSAAGISSAPCPDGSGTESGLTSSAVRLFRSACNAFPALSSYGGYDGHGEHSSGRAIDFMTSDSSLGQALADWARAHASELDLYDVIWAQHIWTPARGGEGWRSMSDRGSATANHYDHVHIAVN
jgi:hypothetical protein